MPNSVLHSVLHGDRLAELIRSGDTDLLSREIYGLVERIVRRAVGSSDRDVVTTATTETVLAVCRHARSFRGDSHAATWIHTIARREAFRSARCERARRMPSIDDGSHSEAIRLGEETSPCSRADALATLASLVPNDDWRSIWLLANEPGPRRTHAEVAALTGYTPGSIGVILSRVRALLGPARRVRPARTHSSEILRSSRRSLSTPTV